MYGFINLKLVFYTVGFIKCCYDARPFPRLCLVTVIVIICFLHYSARFYYQPALIGICFQGFYRKPEQNSQQQEVLNLANEYLDTAAFLISNTTVSSFNSGDVGKNIFHKAKPNVGKIKSYKPVHTVAAGHVQGFRKPGQGVLNMVMIRWSL